MAGEFKAGAVVSKMILDRTQWKKSVGDAKKESKGLGGAIQKHGAAIRKVGMAMTAVGGAIVGSLALMIKNYAAAGDEIDKMSRRTGFAAETLSELAFAAQIAGTDLSSIEKATKKMSKSIVDAGDGLTTYIRAFDRIGISVEDLMKLSPEDQFLKIGNAIAAVENPTIRAAAAVDIFGRAGTQLLPLFDEGVEGMAKLREEAHELGFVFDKEAAAGAARLVDAQLRLKTSMQGVGRSIAETFVPMLSDLAEKAAKVISKISEWMKKNPGLTKTILTIVAGLGGLMLVLGPILIVLPGIVTAVGLMSAGFIAALGPIALVTGAVAALTIGFLKVKSAQDEARKADERYQKNVVKLKTKLNDARKAVGMNAKEWNKLIKAYKGNFAAMAMAIRKGKESVEMQEALAKVSKKSKKAYDEQQKATKDLANAHKDKLTPAIIEVAEKTKTWVDYMNELGIKTVKEKQDRVTELKKYLDELHKAYRSGKIDLGDYEAAIKSAKTEVEDLSTSIITTVIPTIKTIPGVLELAAEETQGHFFEADENIKEDVVTTTQEINGHWSTLAVNMGNSFGNAVEGILSGGVTLKEGLAGLWTEIKGSFFSMVGDMAAEWATTFLKNTLLDLTTKTAKEAGESIVSNLGSAVSDAGKVAVNLAEGIAKAVVALAQGIVGAAKIIAAGAGAILKAAAVLLAVYGAFKLINKLFGAKGGGAAEFTNKILLTMRDHIGAQSEKMDETNRLLAGFYEKYDTMLAQLYQIRDATKGTLEALTTQGTVYVDVFRSAVFEAVGDGISESIGQMGGEIGGAIDGMGGRIGGAIDGMEFPDFDAGRIADEFAKRMPKAQRGGGFISPGPVMTHGTIANPEIIGMARQLSEAGIPGGGTTVVNQTVNINGKMITTREYTREEIIPEILDALDAKVKRSEFQDKLGIR